MEMAIPTKPAEERPTKRTKNLAVRLLDRSTGQTEPLSKLHNQRLADIRAWAGESPSSKKRPPRVEAPAFPRGGAINHNHKFIWLI